MRDDGPDNNSFLNDVIIDGVHNLDQSLKTLYKDDTRYNKTEIFWKANNYIVSVKLVILEYPVNSRHKHSDHWDHNVDSFWSAVVGVLW